MSVFRFEIAEIMQEIENAAVITFDEETKSFTSPSDIRHAQALVEAIRRLIEEYPFQRCY